MYDRLLNFQTHPDGRLAQLITINKTLREDHIDGLKNTEVDLQRQISDEK